MLEENVLISFLEKFNQYPFLVKTNKKEYKIGDGEPEFAVKFNKEIPLSDLLTSTSIALGEAYMNGNLKLKAIYIMPWIIFWGRWINFLQMRARLKNWFLHRFQKRTSKKKYKATTI